MKVKALVIDLDGCLYPNSVERTADLASAKRIDHYLRKRKLLGKMPRRIKEKRARYIMDGRISALIDCISEEMKLSRARLSDYAYDIYPENVGLKRNARLLRLFSELRGKYDLWIFSNAHPKWAVRALKTLGIYRYINKGNVIHMNNMGGYLKPDPRAFKSMLKKVGHNKAEIIFIDNKRSNVYSSKLMGIRSMLGNGNSMDRRDSTYHILLSLLNDKKQAKL